ncbi:MAG: peptidoglycan-binding protein [Chloracidobacterium sp.]|nr:peptidoglycan-binding protein [Chloracidobacterium sp.]
MRKDFMATLSIAIAFLIPVFAFAQTPEPQAVSDWRITEKEVKAVQAELTLQGYYKSKITGVLDRDTRAAVQAYQADNGLNGAGRIDPETYNRLNLTYPATGKETNRLRIDAPASKVGYEVKDATDAAGGDAKKVETGVRGGLEKTWDAGAGTFSKSIDAMKGAGDATIKSLKNAGRASGRIFKRSDSDLQNQIRQLLEDDPETRSWRFEVKRGRVTIKAPPDNKADIGAVVSKIRQIPGVEKVFVIAL